MQENQPNPTGPGDKDETDDQDRDEIDWDAIDANEVLRVDGRDPE